jgi:hypothetical protein
MSRILGTPGMLVLVLLASCATGSGDSARSGGPGDSPDEPKLEKYENYIENPTEIVGDEVTVILPDIYGDDLVVKGLSTGWTEENGKRTWEGSGECRLELRSLRIRCKELTVTLVPIDEDPEVVIQASGNVSLAQQVKGVGSWFDNLRLLMIRNERMRMMEE